MSDGRLYARLVPIFDASSKLGVVAEVVAFDEAISDVLLARLAGRRGHSIR
jgi:hypothetical protein